MVARVRLHIEGKEFVRKGRPQKCVRCDKVPEASGVTWKALNSGRRGAITPAINISGNIALWSTIGTSRILGNHHRVLLQGDA